MMTRQGVTSPQQMLSICEAAALAHTLPAASGCADLLRFEMLPSDCREPAGTYSPAARSGEPLTPKWRTRTRRSDYPTAETGRPVVFVRSDRGGKDSRVPLRIVVG